MVKGISRRVIVVKSPDSKMFEEAIFIVREDLLGRDGVSADDALREARRVAECYARRSARSGKPLSRIPAAAYAAAGAGLTALGWLCYALWF